MDDFYQLEWTFTPSNYFEQELDVQVEGVTIAIRDGSAEARIDSKTYEQDSSLHERLHEHLVQAFRGTQLIALKPFELSRPTKTRIRPDGKREMYLEASTSVAFVKSSGVDFVVRKADGTVIDSKAERLAAKRELAELVRKHSSDDHLAAMLNSIARALTDKANCLVHLYEVRDSLSSKFGGKKQAINALSLSSSQWSELGRLANDEPLQEGRHRGKMIHALRPATKEELDRCKGLATKFVVAYLQYLESQS
ncbi:hypothetical protein [Roseiconus lacunae]|uniref:Anti-bacteriophage protein A/HamA C-terminal domain-containing protein n=1 Tax=Roseiconus lacunae TaxID=2605694 RepID=A0ABT7PDN9_9BACT|nr:hypothetical protein [Roseiconus lacunae]MDM4014623.1 hypothetical protein [Roseiconus lacunae]